MFLYLILLISCLIATFKYNKKGTAIKRFFKSLIYTFIIVVLSLYVAAYFSTAKYNLQDKNFDTPLFEIFSFLEYASMIAIPLIYIIAVLIVMKIDKKNDNKICQSNAKEEDIV